MKPYARPRRTDLIVTSHCDEQRRITIRIASAAGIGKLEALSLVLVCCLSACAEPPAVPQPNLVLYGTVARVPGTETISPAPVKWNVSGNNESITAQDTTVVVIGTEVFYMTRVPFEVRQITGGPTFPATANVLELTRADTTYTRSATVGFNSVERSAMLPAGKSTFVYGAARQGLVERIDLVIGETYDEWSLRIFGSLVSQTADADGDGRTNYDEFLQGTDPLSAQSLSIVRSFVPAAGGGFTISWDSKPARTYTVEWTATLEAANWQPVGPPMQGTGEPLSYTHPASADSKLFFRIAVSLPENR